MGAVIFPDASPVLKILLVFGLILFASRLRAPLGLALIAGGILIDFWAGKALAPVAGDLSSSLLQPELWLLVLNITLILEFGYYMSHRPNAEVLLSASRRLGGKHGRSLSLIFIPAAIGLVPMPGGALFSAPLVRQSLLDKGMSGAWQTAVNYWFRHIFEHWWPLYPVVIVTLSIFSLKTWQFFSLQIPFTFVCLAAGWYFILRRHQTHLAAGPQSGNEYSGRSLFFVLLPLGIVVFCTLLLPGAVRALLPGISPTSAKLLAMLCGLAVSLVLIGFISRHDADFRLFVHLFSSKTVTVVFTLGGVMIFQSMLDSSGLLPEAGRNLRASMIPVELVIAFLPFLAGLVTGIAIGFAGPAFPLVVGLIAPEGGMSQSSALVLAFSMGYVGMMISPLHLCYVLTRQYFTAGLRQTYIYILPCVLAVAVWGILMHIGLRLAGW